jgi:hypothetical protein
MTASHKNVSELLLDAGVPAAMQPLAVSGIM